MDNSQLLRAVGVTLLEFEAIVDLPAKVHRFVLQVLQLQVEVVYLQFLLPKKFIEHRVTRMNAESHTPHTSYTLCVVL